MEDPSFAKFKNFLIVTHFSFRLRKADWEKGNYFSTLKSFSPPALTNGKETLVYVGKSLDKSFAGNFTFLVPRAKPKGSEQ